MNLIEKLSQRLEEKFLQGDVRLIRGKPVSPLGIWTLSMSFADGYMVEIGWQRHRGFGLSACYELDLGTSFDEIFGDDKLIYERIITLVAKRLPTNGHIPLSLAGLRKSRGILQADLSQKIGMSTAGLAQLERAGSVDNMKLHTLEKLIAGLGGKLVVSAIFPDAIKRHIMTSAQAPQFRPSDGD